MSRLSPTSSPPRRGGFLPVALAAIVALAIGIGVGWWFTGRDTTGSGTGATNSPTACASASPGIAYPAPNTVTVNVYNATSRSGLARTTADQLKARGFNIGTVANDPKKAKVAGTAEVRHGPPGLPGAQLMTVYVAGAALTDDQRTDATVDLVIGDGFQQLATPEQVAAATTKPSAGASASASPSPKRSGC